MGRMKENPRYNVVSVRLSDAELKLAIEKAGSKERLGNYIREKLK
jgi:hypothetical protein